MLKIWRKKSLKIVSFLSLLVLFLMLGTSLALAQEGKAPDKKKEDPALEAMCPTSLTDFQKKYDSALTPCSSRPFAQCQAYFTEMKKGLYALPEKYIEDSLFLYDFDCNQSFSSEEKKQIDKVNTKNSNLSEVEKELSKATSGNRFTTYWQKFGSGKGKDLPNDAEFFDVTDPEKGFNAPNQNTSYFNDQENGPVVAFILRIVSLLVGFIGVFALVIIVIAAYYILTANGEEDQINKGKDMIRLALTGMVIAMFSYAIVTFVQSVLY